MKSLVWYLSVIFVHLTNRTTHSQLNRNDHQVETENIFGFSPDREMTNQNVKNFGSFLFKMYRK